MVVGAEMVVMEKNKIGGGDDGVMMVVKTVVEKVVELSPEVARVVTGGVVGEVMADL